MLRSAIRDFLAFYYVPVHGPEATAITVTKMGRPVCLIVWLKFAVGQKGRDRKIKYVLYSIVTNATKNKQKERKEEDKFLVKSDYILIIMENNMKWLIHEKKMGGISVGLSKWY